MFSSVIVIALIGQISMHRRLVPSPFGANNVPTGAEPDLDSLIFLLSTILQIVSSLPVPLLLLSLSGPEMSVLFVHPVVGI